MIQAEFALHLGHLRLRFIATIASTIISTGHDNDTNVLVTVKVDLKSICFYSL